MPRNRMRQEIGRAGAYVKWSNVVDRTEATEAARRNGPGSIDYWLARQDDRFKAATPEQRVDAAEAARRAYFAQLGLRASKARAEKAELRARRRQQAIDKLSGTPGGAHDVA